MTGSDLQESSNFLQFFVFSLLLAAAVIWKVFADVACAGWTPSCQLPHLEHLRFGTLSGEAEGMVSMPTYEDKCGRPTEELAPARRAAANSLRSVLEEAKQTKKKISKQAMIAFPNGRNQLATFSSLSDLNAVNEQPFWDETDSKISSEPVEELLGFGLSSAKVWPSEKGAKTSLQARKGTSNVQNFLLARWQKVR